MVKLPWYFALAFLFCFPAAVLSQPIFKAEAEGAKITLHDEKCEVKNVSNLPYKATWEEKGKVFQGCWAPRPSDGVVLGYFDDLTVVAIPIHVFTKVTAI